MASPDFAIQPTAIIRLSRLVLCPNCEHASDVTGNVCPKCGHDKGLISLASVLNRVEDPTTTTQTEGADNHGSDSQS